ncbi:MAG: intracellular exo-alpha-L-arabinofuranosidase 2 [Phycisphaerae bacterium]|nr:MAG: intracellular exo-alpha-L-arabinofuranosidase 2 [Phycisphaerae bacterium]
MKHRVLIETELNGPTISRHIYGHFAEHLGRCIYDGLWVGEDSPIPNVRGWRSDLVEALKRLRIPNLRWPGGCFADTYHWRDGIGPKSERPGIVNVYWGGTVENNHVGTHEFLDLCEQIGAEPYIAGNVGSGTVREMAEWLEYLTMPGDSPMARLRRQNGREEPWNIRLWGIGNENWGCGGSMRPQYYADLYRQFQTYCRNFTPGKSLYKVACGLTDEWNDILMREAHRFMDGLSIHYYTVPGAWAAKGSATQFEVPDWQLTLQKGANIEQFIIRTDHIMNRYDPQKRIGIVMDEWGTWFDVEPGTNPGFLYQQNTIRDALVAGLTLNILNNHSDRVQVANIAQTVNVLQAVALTEGSRMLRTPTYHVFEMYQVHQDAKLLPTHVLSETYVPERDMQGTSGANGSVNRLWQIKQISVSASLDSCGNTHLTLCNLHHDQPAEVSIEVRGQTVSRGKGRILTAPAMNSMNTFDNPDTVVPQDFEVSGRDNAIVAELPARSVAVLRLS